MTRKIVLASTSPRRRELLERACVPFTVEAPGVEEDMKRHTPKESPAAIVRRLASEKAEAVAARIADAVVIGADTIVALGSHTWSKPESNQEARMMLRALSGKKHEVWTGFCIIDPIQGKKIVRSKKTILKIRKLKDDEIEKYIDSGEPLEGAGGYKMQGTGGFLFDYISGDYNNVLGLPLGAVLHELRNLGAIK